MDFEGPGFLLNAANFVAPKSKVSPYFSSDQYLDDFGDAPLLKLPVGSVLRVGRFESVTMGKMPGRQVIVYDKTAAARVKNELYWFDAWRIGPEDRENRVWRVEVRAGRDSWRPLIGPAGQRTYETVEALLSRYLATALSEIRYFVDRDAVSNVLRTRQPAFTAVTVTRTPTGPLLPSQLTAFFDEPADEELGAALDYMLTHPPKKQIVQQGILVWQTVEPGTNLLSDRPLIYVRRVRNNLFHGGKFNGHWFESQLSEELLRSSLVILAACLDASGPVKEAYDH